jgi:hypothetical protein
MFGDMAILTIWVSLNIAIMMLAMFMVHVFRSGSDRNRQEGMAYEKRTDRRA